MPVVKEIKNTSSFIVKKVTVETNTGKIDFVLDDIDKLIKEVNTQNRKLHDKSLIKLKQLSVQFPEKCSDGLLTWTSMNSVNNLLLIAKAGKKAAGVVSNPLGALSAILLKEFYDLTISDFVKNKMKQGV